MKMRVAGVVALVVLVSGVAVAGCSLFPFGRPAPGTGPAPSTDGATSGGDDWISPGSSEAASVRLYFADSEAMYLVPEDRAVTLAPGETYEEAVIAGLLAGPQEAGHHKTIPEGVKLLSLEIVDGVAYVNFSKEIQTNHWGGSTGEMFTIMSIVDSLTESPRVQAVQFLIEGQRVESLVGHADTTRPIERSENMISDGE